MPRKGENIRKRKDGRWEARYEKCRDQNGRIQYGYLYGRTYEAVKKKKLAVLCQNNLQNSPGKCYVFRNLSEEWMLSMRYAVKLSTYACYETLLDTHILPEFGDMPLKYISSASVYAFSEKLKQQGLSPRTIKNLLILFHSILRYGEKQGYLNLSQLEFRYPKINTSPFQLISHEHLTKLITVLSAEDSEFPIGILLCIYTGIRVGELSGIRWEDIDFEKNTLMIRNNLVYVNGKYYLRKTKTDGSTRDITVPEHLMHLLKKEKIRQNKLKIQGLINNEHDVVCLNSKYKYWNNTSFTTAYKTFLNKINMRYVKLHSLRHSHATMLIASGTDMKTVSARLGHTDIKITLNIYSHILKEMDNTASKKKKKLLL